MTEENRKDVISKIKKEIEENNSLVTKYEELKRLTKDPTVAKYLHLLEEIGRIERDIETYRNPINGSIEDSLQKRIRFWFRVGHFSCDHDVWLYDGSYYRYTNFKNEEDYMRYNSEHSEDNLHSFSYNKYVCLECGKEVKILKSDWRKFENSHLVLKIQDYIDIKRYQDLYYQLLYNNYDFDDAQQVVIDEFNKDNKNRTKVLVNKNNLEIF